MDFTDKGIKALHPKETAYRIREKRGFTIRVLPSGIKRFEFIYDSPLTNKRRFMSLGNYADAETLKKSNGGVSLKTAHQLYNDAYRLYMKGIDPQAPPTPETEPVPVNKKTVKFLYEFYIDYCTEIKLAARSIKHKKQQLTTHIVDPWGERFITDVKKDDAVSLIRILAKDKPGTARNVMLAARAMFNVGIEEGWSEEVNPFSNIIKRVPQAAANEVERFLNIAEIQYVFPLLRSGKSPSIIRRAIMMVLLTGQRPGEVAGLKWTDFERGGRYLYWFITTDIAKNNLGSLVYISAYVRRLIAPLRGLDSVYVFPASRGAEGPILVTSLDSHVQRYLGGGNYAGLPRWNPHDTRRTCSTHLQRLKCPDSVIAAIQNHKQPGIARIYNRYEYVAEKREWLIKWAWELRRILRSKM